MAKTSDVTDASVREELIAAEDQLDEGDYNECVRRSAAIYQRILTERPDLRIERRGGPSVLSAINGRPIQPRFQPWPSLLGVALTFDDHEQPLMKFDKDDFSMSEAITYFEHTLDAAVRVQEEPAPDQTGKGDA